MAELHDAKTGEVLYDGKTVEHTFTAQEPSGFEVVRINGIDTLELAGKTITVYEKLYDAGGSLIAKHTDKDDVNQQVTVIVPEIGTTAVDGADGDKLVSTDDAATVVDTVHYKNLIPGNRYALVGALFVKKTAEDGEVTGEPLMVDGAPVVSHNTFTPETADGDADVTFTFDSLALKDGTQLVACEVLFGLGFEPESFTDIELRPFWIWWRSLTPASTACIPSLTTRIWRTWVRRSPSRTPRLPPPRWMASTTTRT